MPLAIKRANKRRNCSNSLLHFCHRTCATQKPLRERFSLADGRSSQRVLEDPVRCIRHARRKERCSNQSRLMGHDGELIEKALFASHTIAIFRIEIPACTLLDLSPGGALVLGDITWLNVLGQPFAEAFVHPDDKAAFLRLCESAQKEEVRANRDGKTSRIRIMHGVRIERFIRHSATPVAEDNANTDSLSCNWPEEDEVEGLLAVEDETSILSSGLFLSSLPRWADGLPDTGAGKRWQEEAKAWQDLGQPQDPSAGADSRRSEANCFQAVEWLSLQLEVFPLYCPGDTHGYVRRRMTQLPWHPASGRRVGIFSRMYLTRSDWS
jgi:hypothetical protein